MRRAHTFVAQLVGHVLLAMTVANIPVTSVLDLLFERNVLALQGVQPIDALVQETLGAVHLNVLHQFRLLKRDTLAQRLHHAARGNIA